MTTTTRLISTIAEHKKYRDLQFLALWEGRTEDASFYRSEANRYKKLIQQGVLWEPTF